MDSGLLESETHPAPVVLNYNLRVYVHKAGNFAWITIHYGVCYQNHWKIQGALGMCAPLLVKGFFISMHILAIILSNNKFSAKTHRLATLSGKSGAVLYRVGLNDSIETL